MKTKIAKLIVDYFYSKGVRDVFILTGGAIAFIADAVKKNKKMRLIPTYHEQGASIMSDGYNRISKYPSICMVTSGPGVTNIVTGIACSWYDSKPGIYISGQVRSDELKSKKNRTDKIRQVGFQETDVVSLVKSITKFSYQLKKKDNLIKILDKAYLNAFTNRQGPVLIDIPIDLQNYKTFYKNKSNINFKKFNKRKKIKLNSIIKLISTSKKPLLLVGGGVKYGDRELLNKILKKLNIPVVNTWNGFDLVSYKNPNFFGTVGIYGNRASNYALQNCDLLIVLGSRLETRVIGRDKKNFAKNAKIIHVDIDKYELQRKRDKKTDIKIYSSTKDFLIGLNLQLQNNNLKKSNYSAWFNFLKKLKDKYLIPGKEQNLLRKKTNPYIFFEKISNVLSKNTNIFVSTGSTVTWAYQSFKIKLGQRFISANGHSPMGYALPASIGGYFADPKKICICIEGDGSFQLNFQELQVAKIFKIPLKIIVLNNQGYGIIRQFQDQNLKSKYIASDSSEKVVNPDFKKIAKVYNFRYHKISNNSQIDITLRNFLKNKEASILEVEVDKGFNIIPRVQLNGSLENMFPTIKNLDNTE
ncbi:thiamine pyrophosphate-binding protein [Candidatus Pelagibacter sp.]|nr:thiamine pyrophosphate-binding protein [Candidatus Pelagibacter sp.]